MAKIVVPEGRLISVPQNHAVNSPQLPTFLDNPYNYSISACVYVYTKINITP